MPSLKIILISVWILAVGLCSWLQVGPYAMVVEVQLGMSKGYNPQTTNTIFWCAALAPLSIVFLRDGGFSPVKFVVRAYRFFNAALIALVACAVYSLLSASSPANLKEVSEVDKIAQFSGRDFYSAGLIKSFDFAKQIRVGLVNDKGKVTDEQGQVYLPTRLATPQSKAVILCLEPRELAKLAVEIPEPNPPRYDSRPDSAKIRIMAVDSSALGDFWTVKTRPIPYLVRKGLNVDSNILFANFITVAGAADAEWVAVVVMSLAGLALLLYLAKKDKHLWNS